mgnify:CR=1 FL=1
MHRSVSCSRCMRSCFLRRRRRRRRVSTKGSEEEDHSYVLPPSQNKCLTLLIFLNKFNCSSYLNFFFEMYKIICIYKSIFNNYLIFFNKTNDQIFLKESTVVLNILGWREYYVVAVPATHMARASPSPAAGDDHRTTSTSPVAAARERSRENRSI